MSTGMCFSGTGKSGYLPPGKECASGWHENIIQKMPHIQLALLIGKYAQDYYLKETAKENLTQIM
jgi:uracil-DNA glycosylase